MAKTISNCLRAESSNQILVVIVIELIRGAYLKKSFVACSFAVIAGYLYLVYVGVNVLLMVSTAYIFRSKYLLPVGSSIKEIGLVVS